MKLVIFDPQPSRNEYASLLYFKSLRSYCADHGIKMVEVHDVDAQQNCTLVMNGDYLNPERILRLRSQNCRLVAFDINDNSLLSDAYRSSEELSEIDLIFKIGGIQLQNDSQDLSIDQDFNFSLNPRQFLLEPLWNRYQSLWEASRLQSLPYVPWHHTDAPQRDYGARSGKVLVRGGNHFYRFITFLNLAKRGMADPRSSFVTADYFRRDMNPQFRNCEDCIREKEGTGKSLFLSSRSDGCTSPAIWDGIGFTKGVQDLDTYETANHWNNRCPRSFFWLTEQFEKKHGPVDHALVERALNGSFESSESFYDALSQATFYTDLKWLFSIYAPPRFWEAANAGTVNLLPRRTIEQSYFPHIEEGKHYMTFLEDFSDLSSQTDPCEFGADFEEITSNAKELFNHWIRPNGRRSINDNLCHHILEQIERFTS